MAFPLIPLALMALLGGGGAAVASKDIDLIPGVGPNEEARARERAAANRQQYLTDTTMSGQYELGVNPDGTVYNTGKEYVAPTAGDVSGGTGGNLIGGGVFDPAASLQAQQTREAQGIRDSILGRRGEVDTILNDILGRVDNLLRDRKAVRDQQYGFDTEALVDSLKGSIPEIDKAFASLGLSNSTFVGDRRDDTNRQYQLSQGATDRALASDLAEYGQWADTEKSKARTNASDMRHTFDSIEKMTPNHMNLSDLQRSELELNKGLSGFGEQKNRFTTSGDALQSLNRIGSDYDFDQILDSFATTASAKADTGSGGAASQAVLDNIQGNNKKKRLTETQINNPVGAATA